MFNFNKKGATYLKYQICSVLLFAILYQTQDVFISYNEKISKQFGLVAKDYKYNNDTPNSLLYYIWFSLITQTTVGYGGLYSEKNNENIKFTEISYRPYKVLNLMQLVSVFYIMASVL